MPDNSAPPATALTFEEERDLRKRIAYMTSSPEETWIDGDIWLKTLATIDALRERERRLWEYLAHKKDCHFYYCRTCDSAAQTLEKRHSRIYYGDHAIDRGHCTCRLAELLAAKEGS